MLRTVSVVAALSVGLWVASARAQPFGGDDTGFIPPDAPKGPITKCEAGAAKAESKLIACIFKCHANRVKGKFADDTAEDSCEKTLAGKSCAAKFAASIAKLKGCPPCINGTTMASLAGVVETFIDSNNAAVYCAGPSTTTTSTTTSTTSTTLCTLTIFNFSVNSSGGGPFTDSSWNDGSQTQPSASAPCNVTVKAPSGDITLVGTLGDAWTVSGFAGFSSCVLTGGCNANGGTCTSCNGVDAPSSCPPLGIPNCTDNRPSCSTGLNGNASDSAHVTCSP